MSLVDKILGKDELKDRIEVLQQRVDELQEEKENLKKRYEKDRERTKEAVSEKQELHERINKKEDKIQSLKDKLRKRDMVDKASGGATDNEGLDRSSLESILAKLESIESGDEDLFTVYLPSDGSVGGLGGRGNIRSELTLNKLKKLKNTDSRTGKILFHSPDIIDFFLLPPLPVEEEEWSKSDGFLLEPLKEQLDKRLGFIFLSAGGSGVAVFDDGIDKTDVIGSEIKNKHKKGGFSQDRFSEQRENELKSHVEEVQNRAYEIFEDIDVLVVSGSEEMIGQLEIEDYKVLQKNVNLSKISDEEDFEVAFNEVWRSYRVDF